VLGQQQDAERSRDAMRKINDPDPVEGVGHWTSWCVRPGVSKPCQSRFNLQCCAEEGEMTELATFEGEVRMLIGGALVEGFEQYVETKTVGLPTR